MRDPRIFVDQPLAAGCSVSLGATATRYLLKVLRLREDAPVRLFSGDGREFRGRLCIQKQDSSQARIEALARNEPEPRFELNLLLGISKGERMDVAIQKAVELGVTRITTVLTQRSVVRLDDERRGRRAAHWRGVVVSACEQSGRCRLPRLDVASNLHAALEASGCDRRLVLDPKAEGGLDQFATPRRGIDLLVGPEGGLDPWELGIAMDAGFVAVRLGPRVMRTETAPLAALAAIQMLWGDFRGG
jgi:16S rRNA (uracil1498-N3)-methyltransferase